MSGTVMKFGPQWLRALTDGGTAGIGSNTGNEAASQSSSATSSTTSNNGTSHQPSSPQQQVMQSNNITNNNHPYQTSLSMPPSLSTLAGSVSQQQQQKRQPPQITKYKLAEFRYGREEMLALFDRGMTPPEELKKYTDLFVESARIPMTMVQMSEEEVRLSTRNWNSDAVLRATGKAAGSTTTATSERERGSITETRANAIPPGASSASRGPPGSLSTRSSMTPDSRGLTGSQLRGPPGRLVRAPGPYARSQSHEDEALDDGLSSYLNHDPRGTSNHARDPLKSRYEPVRLSGLASKPIGLDQNKVVENEAGERRSVFDRPLPVRNGIEDKLGVVARKESAGSRPAQSNDWRSRDNWAGTERTSKVSTSTEERPWRTSRAPDDWRSPNPSSSSWYSRSDDRNNQRNAAQDTDNLSSSYNSNSKRDTLRRPSGGDKHGEHHYEDDEIHHRHRRDSLPEWSVDDPSGDKVGSFDASGAFRESTAEDDNEGSSIKHRQESSQERTDGKNFAVRISSNNSINQNDEGGRKNNDWRSNDSNGDEPIPLNGSRYISEEDNVDIATLMSLTSGDKTNSGKNVEGPGDSTNLKQSPNSIRKNIHERFPCADQTSNIDTQNNQEGPIVVNSPSLAGDDPKKRIIEAEMNNQTSSQTCQQLIDQAMSRHEQQTELQMLLRNQFDQQLRMSAFNNQMNVTSQAPNEEDGFAHLERAAEIMVAEWTAEEEHVEPNIVNPVKFVDNMNQNQRGAQFNTMHHENRLAGQQSQQPGDNHMTVTTPPADTNDSNRFIVLPFNHENSQNWFYRDTQGVIQGPFNATEMFEWFKAGYFVKELLIRRACDECFCQLGDIMKLWERIPFLPNVPPHPPITAGAIYQQRE